MSRPSRPSRPSESDGGRRPMFAKNRVAVLLSANRPIATDDGRLIQHETCRPIAPDGVSDDPQTLTRGGGTLVPTTRVLSRTTTLASVPVSVRPIAISLRQSDADDCQNWTPGQQQAVRADNSLGVQRTGGPPCYVTLGRCASFRPGNGETEFRSPASAVNEFAGQCAGEGRQA